MGKSSESGTTRNISLSIRKVVPFRRSASDNSKNPGVKLSEELVCSPYDAGAQKLLEYCCKKVAAKYAEWEHNSK